MEFSKYVKADNRDLLTAVKEGMHPMQVLFLDTPAGPLPYFRNLMEPDPEDPETSVGNHMTPIAVPHMAGRWLDGLLSAEEVTGTDPGEEVIRALQKASFDTLTLGVPGLPCAYDEKLRVSRVFDIHTLRESMHGLAALAKYRKSEEAVRIARLQIDAFTRYFDFETGEFDEARLLSEQGGTVNRLTPGRLHFAECFGRYIGPLVKMYRAAELTPALELALKLKDTCFRYILKEDGHFDAELFGTHLHSATSMISSLALLGETVGDGDILGRVRAFMEGGLHDIALDFGWCSENFRRYDLVGEINNSADLLETCLVLGRAGDAARFAQAERIMRGHILPAQLLDTGFVPQFSDPDDPDTHNLAENAKGAFGFPAPYGHEYKPGYGISFNYDIVGGGVSGLCHAYRSCVTQENGLLSVNLLFDYEDERIKIASPYGRGDTLTLVSKRGGPARVRVMDNIDIGGLAVSGCSYFISGSWIYLTGLSPDRPVSIRFAMRERTISYTYRYESFRLRWRGETVTGASSAGKRLCFFPEID